MTEEKARYYAEGLPQSMGITFCEGCAHRVHGVAAIFTL